MGQKRAESEEIQQGIPTSAAKGSRRRGGRDMFAPVPPPDPPALDETWYDDGDTGDDDPAPRDADKLPFKLSPTQRRLLIELLAKYEYVHIVRAELALLDPTFPDITDQAMRYYRTQIRKGKYAWVRQFQQEFAQQGIGNRDRRIALLDRQYRMLSRVPVVSIVNMRNPETDATEEAYIVRIDVSKELREIMMLAERIDTERTAVGIIGIATQTSDIRDPLNDLALEEVRDELSEMVFAIRETQEEVEAAILGAVRPQAGAGAS